MNKVLKIIIVIVICLILILAATLIFSQCSKNEADPTTTTKPSTTTTPKVDPDPTPECTTHIDANTDYICDVCQAQLEKPNDGFTATNDKVYVISTELNVRKTPDTTGNPVGSVLMDQELDRLGYYDNGWSKILYNGEECYVSTSYITESKPITDFEECNDTVYFLKETFAYSKPSYITTERYSEKMDTLFVTSTATRVGIAKEPYIMADGTQVYFAIITYKQLVNGVEKDVTYYVNNADLTTKMPIDLNPDGDIVFEECNKILISNRSRFWLRKSTLFSDSERVIDIPKGTILQGIASGVESDGTIWYKVLYKDVTYYIIYQAPNKDPYFSLYDTVESNFESLFGEYSISLSEKFVIYDSDEMNFSITDTLHSIKITNTGNLSVESIIPTAKEVALSWIKLMKRPEITVQEKNGVTYFEFETRLDFEDKEITVYTLVTFVAGNNNNYYVTSFSGFGEKTELENIFWDYADTIKIAPKQ